MKIGRKEFKFFIDGREPFMELYQYEDDGEYYMVFGLFSFIRRIKLNIYNFKLKKRFKHLNFPIKKCCGCKFGISEWLLGNQYYVCKKCNETINFHIHRVRLESLWTLQTERGVGIEK